MTQCPEKECIITFFSLLSKGDQYWVINLRIPLTWERIKSLVIFPGGKVWGRLGSLAQALIWEDVGPHYFWGIPILKKSICVYQNEIKMYLLSCIFSGNPTGQALIGVWNRVLGEWKGITGKEDRTADLAGSQCQPTGQWLARVWEKDHWAGKNISAESPTQRGYRLAPRWPRALHCPEEPRALNTDWHSAFLSILADGNLLG